MMTKNELKKSQRQLRREFLQRSIASGTAAYAALSLSSSAHAAGDDLLKIGLIGCGGRGTGAALNALGADKNCKTCGDGRRLQRSPAKQSGRC